MILKRVFQYFWLNILLYDDKRFFQDDGYFIKFWRIEYDRISNSSFL